MGLSNGSVWPALDKFNLFGNIFEDCGNFEV